MTTMNLRLSQNEKDLIFEYAKMQGVSASSFILDAAIEKIEDAIDLYDAKEALAEYRKDPVSYTLEDIKKEFGI